MKKIIQINILFLFFYFFTGLAQTPSEVYFPSYNGWKNYYEKVENKFGKEIESGRWDVVFEYILKNFQNSSINWQGKENIKLVVEKHIIDLIEAYRKTVVNSITTKKGIEENIKVFIESYATGIFQMDVSSGFVVFFSGTNDEIKLIPENLNELQAKKVRDTLQTINAFLHKIKKKEREKLIKSIKRAHERWKNFIFDGFSQYPWEALLNGYFTSFDIQYPPKVQYIVLHPELSFELKTDNLQAKLEVLTVEVLGLLRYKNNWKNFFGVSFIVNMREDLGAGIGGMIHYNMYSLGIVWHDVDDDGNRFNDPPFITVGLDLYKLFEDKNSNLNKFLNKIFPIEK